jgi:hypothetical protein
VTDLFVVLRSAALTLVRRINRSVPYTQIQAGSSLLSDFCGHQGIMNFRFILVVAFSLLSSVVKAEGTMIATVLQADFSKDPEVRLLVRVVDIGFGPDAPSMALRKECLARVKSTDRPGPDPCFSIEITESKKQRAIVRQTLLNDPQRSTDPIYLEIVYQSEVSASDPTNHYGRSAWLKIEENGFYNWNNETKQALADVVWPTAPSGTLDLVVSDTDALLNLVYRERMERLDENARKGLRETQRAWMKFRDAECLPEPKSSKSVFGEWSNSCLIRATIERARQLAMAPDNRKQ